MTEKKATAAAAADTDQGANDERVGQVVDADFENALKEKTISIATETMVGDLLAALVDEIKVLPDPWQKTSEHKQQLVIDRLTRRVETAVKQAVHIIASDAAHSIEATLEGVTLKDKNKATLIIPNTPLLHELCDRRQEQVLIVLPNVDQYQGGKDKVKPQKDQPGLPSLEDTGQE